MYARHLTRYTAVALLNVVMLLLLVYYAVVSPANQETGFDEGLSCNASQLNHTRAAFLHWCHAYQTALLLPMLLTLHSWGWSVVTVSGAACNKGHSVLVC